ncbi:uncharacterized protein BX664DRAFT_362254 [Halteromyces radiatus]|uniref:uncharacterized protein n=1 Tax=Halteromyces radiatus TaxID=101107 RepID=UPI002220739A|nr:uncharacterized protein BX664DRAFT_362254 [Halteromyces radiatus]KAI8078677.1 hypothetical protein BX664DRAFT_362254 [Halteromyces radiatus]
MTTPTSNAISPSSSIYSSSTVNSSIGRSASNRSLYRDLTSTATNNNSSTGGRKPTTMGRSRQNTSDFMTGEDLVRTIGSDYQEIQKRTLTRWVNTQLKIVDDHITNIETDFKDGRKLLKLLSVVSKEPAPKPEKMNMRIHQLANVAQALSFLEKQLGADSIVDMGNEAIVNGDKKKTLALIFFIMIKYQIQIVLNDHGDDFTQSLLNYSDRQRDGLRIDSLSPTNETTATNNNQPTQTEKGAIPTTPIPVTNSLLAARKLGSNYSINSDKQHTSSAESKLALLFWVRIQLEDYIAANIIPSIQDFSRSWRNGLAFCLLIHRHGPGLVPDLFSYHLKDADLTQKQTWHRLLTLAFDLATEHMEIPRYLEPEDLVDVDYPHEPSVMMYVAEFYKVMSRVQQEISAEQRHEAAIRRRTNIAMVTGGIDNLMTMDDEHHIHDSDTAITDDIVDDNESMTSSVSNNNNNNNKNKKKAHRISTLADEDKERIKADLNSRLMMQLTGHLPRGVNPVLDQLITIHETVLAFIKTNTRTLDEIPTSFDDADTVAEYLDALEIVEEQMQDESTLLDTAKDAKDKLILPPETADDSIIRLTDLQRTQVNNLYDMLLNHWTDFEQLLSATKCDLLRIESDLVDIEEGTHKYHTEADKVLDKIKELQLLLSQVPPRHDDDGMDDIDVTDGTKKKGDVWHPLDPCSEDGQMENLSILYQQAAEAANEKVELFDDTTWKSYRRFILQFSRVILKQVTSSLQELEQEHQELMNTNQQVLSSSKDFSRALVLISTTTAIGMELESIHKLMDDNNHTTNDAILDLEKQVNAVRTRLHNTREMHDDLLANDTRLMEYVDKVQQQYETVRDWVDQVRVWFIEAERIRKWIEARIDIIHQRNESAEFDPLDDILVQAAQENATLWHEEHVKLGREIDRFDADDMARLRTHVKTLTGTDRGNRDLSPADTSTIEITLTTLNMLNQLMHLLRQRSYMVDMLMLRVQWDHFFESSTKWIMDTNQSITDFLAPGHARWVSSNGDGSDNNSTNVDSSDDNKNNNSNRRRQSIRSNNATDTEEMIQTLVTLENDVIQFDQGLYSECLDAYQEMEDLQNDTLPSHLDSKQSRFEDSFGDLMKRVGFARKVVEQHLTLLDITTQYRQLRNKGEALRISMMSSSKSTTTQSSSTAANTDDNDVYGDQVQAFKEESSQLITYVFPTITYTETPIYVSSVIGSQDAQDNEKANDAIKDVIQAYAMRLATIAEALENLLVRHRRAFSLQQRATLAYEEMMRLILWLDERCEMYKKSWLDGDKIDDEDGDDNNDKDDDNNMMVRYQRELDGILARMKQLEEGDLSRLRARVSAIEDEIDASNAISIDRSTLVNAVEQLDDSHLRLRQLLGRRAMEMTIMSKQQLWEVQLLDVNHTMDNIARELWSLVDSINLQVNANGDCDDEDSGDNSTLALDQQKSLVESTRNLSIFTSTGCYADLEEAYHQLNSISSSSSSTTTTTTTTSIPTPTKEKQLALIDKLHDLDQLYLYTQRSIDYKNDMKSLVGATKEATIEANRVHEEAVILFNLVTPGTSQSDYYSKLDSARSVDSGLSISSHSSSGTDLVLHFKQIVDDLSRKRTDIQAPTNGSTLFTSLRSSAMTYGESTESINKWLNSKFNDLQSVLKSLEQLQFQYLNAMATKEQARRYMDEANHQLQWIDKHISILKTCHIDISDDSINVTEDNIQTREQELDRLSDDISTFKENHVMPLKVQVEALIKAASSATTDDTTSFMDALDTSTLAKLTGQVNSDMNQLERQTTMESQALNTIRQCMQWEKDLQQLVHAIGSLQEQLYPLASETKEKAMQDDLSMVDLGLLETSCAKIGTQVKTIHHTVMDARQRFMNNLSPAIYAQLQPSSSASIVCDRLETRLVGMERSFTRCQDTLKGILDEIVTLKEQRSWQIQVNETLDVYDDLSMTVESFVEIKARWQPDTVISEDDEVDLRNAWIIIKDKLDGHYQQNTQPLLQDIQAWRQRREHLPTLGSNGGSMGDWPEKAIRSLQIAHDVVEKYLAFSNEIINQRCLMVAFLWRTSQLERSAEVIREEFLDQGDDNYSDEDWLTDHSERLHRFKSGIEDIRHDLGATIPLPVRSGISISSSSSSSLLPANFKRSRSPSMDHISGVKDETTNAIIRETIDTRMKRLEELVNGLESLLDSKERMSRRQVSRVLYGKQVEICEAWIDTQMDKLHSALGMLGSPDDGLNDNLFSSTKATIDIQQLRDAIGMAESIEAATRGNDTVFSSLQSAYNTCKGTFRESDDDLNDLLRDYERLEDKWNDLQRMVSKTTELLFGALGPTEMNNRIKHLWEIIHGLQAEMNGMDSGLLTDDHILQWQKQIDTLDKNDYNAAIKMMASLSSGNSNNNNNNNNDSKHVNGRQRRPVSWSNAYDERQQRQQLDQIGETILSIRNIIARLYDVVNLNRLCKTYADNAMVAKAKVDDTRQLLLTIQQQSYQALDDPTTTVQHYHDALQDAYQEAKLKLADCKETYDDLCAYNNFIESQKVQGDECEELLDDMETTQKQINGDWKTLQALGQSVSNMTTMASRLMEGHELMTKMEQNIQIIQQDINNNLSSSPSADEVYSLEKQIQDGTEGDMTQLKMILDSLDDDSSNNNKNLIKMMFIERYDQVAAQISGLYQVVDQHKRQLERSKLLDSLNEEIARLQVVCEEQLKFIRQQVVANPDLVGKRPESIGHISQTYMAAMSNIEKVYEKCKDDYQMIVHQTKRLVDYYQVPVMQMETIKRPLEKTLQDLDNAIQTENEYNAALKLVMRQTKTEVELVRSLSDRKATLLKYSKQGLRTRLNALPDLTEFNRRNADLTKSVEQFFAMGEDFKKSKLYKSIGVARTSSVNKAVDHCQTIVRRMWTEVKSMMDETKVRLDEMYRRQHGTSKLNDALRYVDDIKDRINTLQLSGKSVTVEEDELKELDHEIKVTLTKKIEEMDLLLASISDSDGMIRKQRAQLSTATDQLHHLLQVRQEQAQTEGNITLFLGIIDQVDEQIVQLLVAVENSAPHHAKVVQGKFVKTDLQELLRRLVGVYKKNGPSINKLLGSAKEEARKQFLDDNDRVAKRLEKTMDRWTKAQAAAAAREKELHTCINALNHEFFTKLAMAKTKTANRRPSQSNVRSLTPVGGESSSPSSSSSSIGSLPPRPPSSMGYTRRPSFQSSALSVDHRNTTRRSKTPIISSSGSKPRSTYIADPKNELDVQLGRIVNNSAFKVNVKMVSGEVGKYYFGERLVYCRILPSKMVMVRVGGGWVELSQFLKDHGHNDNNKYKITKNNNNISNNHLSVQQDDEVIKIRGGRSNSVSSINPHHSVSKSSNRSKSPVPSGYLDGDSFIHVGEDGNPVVMKMTRAKEDATTPVKRFS